MSLGNLLALKNNSQLNDITPKVNNMNLAVSKGSPSGAYANLTALQTAFPTGNTNIYVVTADGGWYFWNGTAWTKGGTYQSTGIADSSVTPNKLSFMTASKNLFNKDAVTDGQDLYSSSGLTKSDATKSLSEYITVSPSTAYTLNDVATLCFYDASKTFISGGSWSTSPHTFNTPSNASFVRLGVPLADKSTIQLEIGSSATVYTAYGYKFDGKLIGDGTIGEISIKPKSISSASLTDDVPKFEIVNLFNKSVATLDYKADWTNGTLFAQSPYFTSEYIAVTPNTVYSKSDSAGLAFYDASKTFVSGITPYTTAKTFTTPSNCYFVRISGYDKANIDMYQMSKGDTLPSYTPYQYTFVRKINNIPLCIDDPSNIDTNTWVNKKYVSFGDSITANNNWQPLVATKFALNHVNKGIGGTFVSYIDNTSMCDDNRINSIDSDADIITFEGGGNDWRNNVSLGTINDIGNTTFYGAVKMVAEKLITRFPTKYIIFMSTPCGISPNRAGWTDTTGYKNNIGLTTTDYAQVIKDVAKLYGIPCIDINGDAGYNRLNISSFCTQDADQAYLHPNSEGAKRIASLVVSKLKQLAPIS